MIKQLLTAFTLCASFAANAYPIVFPVRNGDIQAIDVASRWDTKTYSVATQNGSTAGLYVYLSNFSCNGNNRLFLKQQTREYKAAVAVLQSMRAMPQSSDSVVRIGYEPATCRISYVGFTL